MQKITLKSEARALVIMLAGLILSYWSYPQLPARVASHWNFQGQVDGWSSSLFHALLFPGIMIVLYFSFLIMPYFDPKKERYAEFEGVYRIIRDAILFVFLGVFAAATLYNLNYPINVSAVVASLVGFLMIVMGNYFGKLKRNWFIGIRTPWSLSSENVWNKTHRLGGRLFIIWGFLIILAPWLSAQLALSILLIGLGSIIFGVYLYSYLLYRREQLANKTGKNEHI